MKKHKRKKATKLKVQVLQKQNIRFALAAILLIIAGLFINEKFDVSLLTPEQTQIVKNLTSGVQQDTKLPSGWKTVAEDQDNVKIKLEKDSPNIIKPVVVLIKSQTDETDLTVYTDRLLKGTSTSLPSFTIMSDETNAKGGFQRMIEAYYYNDRNRVDITQHIIIRDNDVFTLTSSTDPIDTQNLSGEISQIFSSLQDKYNF